MLQSFNSTTDPKHWLPPSDGAGLVQERNLFWMPPPQLFEQDEYPDHSLQPPWTECNYYNWLTNFIYEFSYFIYLKRKLCLVYYLSHIQARTILQRSMQQFYLYQLFWCIYRWFHQYKFSSDFDVPVHTKDIHQLPDMILHSSKDRVT